MMYDGIALVAACISTFLLAKESKLAFQPASLCLTRTNTKFKSWLDDPVCLIGRPK